MPSRGGVADALQRLRDARSAKEARKQEVRPDVSADVPADSATSLRAKARSCVEAVPPNACAEEQEREEQASECGDGDQVVWKMNRSPIPTLAPAQGSGRDEPNYIREDKEVGRQDCDSAKVDESKDGPGAAGKLGSAVRCKDARQDKVDGTVPECTDSASQAVPGGGERLRKRSRQELEVEDTTGGDDWSFDRTKRVNLFFGDAPCRMDVSTLAARMLAAGVDPLKRSGKMARPTYVYGNYPRYYGIRKDDDRLEALEESWFHNLDCLDVGCHEGLFTLKIVTKFRPKSMTGVDIDPKLSPELGRRNIKKAAAKIWTEEIPEDEDQEQATHVQNEAKCSLKNTKFFTGDYAAQDASPDTYDTISMFSVIKWIHFHHGDAGVKFVFKKVFSALRPGGHFIFEPQAWASYAQAKRKQNMKDVPFYDLTLLKFRPADFFDYLVNEIGFEAVKSFAFPDKGGGFSRPIFVLKKPNYI